ADDCAAEPLAKEQIGEVAGGVAFCVGRPVHVVVDDDRTSGVRREDGDGVQFADEERRVGQLYEAAGGTVHWVGRADHGEPGGLAGGGEGLGGRGRQSPCGLAPAGGPV